VSEATLYTRGDYPFAADPSGHVPREPTRCSFISGGEPQEARGEVQANPGSRDGAGASAGGDAPPRRDGGEGAGAGSLSTRARLARFAVVGASGVVVNLAALWVLAGVLRVREVLASAIAIEVSILWNFALNNAFTYRDRNGRAAAGLLERAVRYNAVSLIGLALQLGTFVLVRALLLRGLGREALGALRYPAQCAGIALATLWNFTGNLHFTWRQARARESAA
jgi:putative flippase GtrA